MSIAVLAGPLVAAGLLLGAERVAYAWIWRRPNRFRALASRGGAGDPVAALHRLFWAFKAIQALTFIGWCAHFGGEHWWQIESSSSVRWLGAGLIVVGQVLNLSVFARLGRVGVFYGARFGHRVPWCTRFPFSALRHPQYVGVVITVWGLFAVARHPHGDWLALPLLETVFYALAAHLEGSPVPVPRRLEWPAAREARPIARETLAAAKGASRSDTLSQPQLDPAATDRSFIRPNEMPGSPRARRDPGSP
jgi:methylene-fatty-acyl-phospholipid synthase